MTLYPPFLFLHLFICYFFPSFSFVSFCFHVFFPNGFTNRFTNGFLNGSAHYWLLSFLFWQSYFIKLFDGGLKCEFIRTFFSISREKILLGKRCRFHCSWKLVALSLTVLTLILSSVIAYFGGKFFVRHPRRDLMRRF